MKQLEIKTNKRILIVEDYTTGNLDNYYEKYRKENPGKYLKFICKGSDITEDIAKGFTHSMNFGTDENPDIGYHHSIKDNYWCRSALESFVSAIEASGYHWGENPVKEPLVIMYDDFNPWAMQAHDDRVNAWKESESRTLKPDQCIIYEIL